MLSITIPVLFPEVPLTVESIILLDKDFKEYPNIFESLKECLQRACNENLNDFEIMVKLHKCVSDHLSYLRNGNTSLEVPLDKVDIGSDIKTCSINDSEDKEVLNKAFACRICRTTLFTNYDLNEHSAINNSISSSTMSPSSTCTSWFLNGPDRCNLSNPNELGGKLLCPHCCTRIGTWNWTGTKCSCTKLYSVSCYCKSILTYLLVGGQWIVPAFQYIKSKIDIK